MKNKIIPRRHIRVYYFKESAFDFISANKSNIKNYKIRKYYYYSVPCYMLCYERIDENLEDKKVVHHNE